MVSTRRAQPFKPVVGLAGIASGVVQWDTQIDDRGSFRLPGGEREYRDWSWTVDNSGGQGMVDLRRAIYRSSNVYFYDVASRLDVNYLAGFAEDFGFGRNLAVDIKVMPVAAWCRTQSGNLVPRVKNGTRAIQSIWVLVREICW